MSNKINIFWFRQDLRLSDNPGLIEAARDARVLPIYIVDTRTPDFVLGAATKWWLHHSLHILKIQLNNCLNVYEGDPEEILLNIIENNTVEGVYWNRVYEPWRMQQDAKIKTCLKQKNITCKSFNATLLWEPSEIIKKDGSPYKVYTAYKKACLHSSVPRVPLGQPQKLSFVKDFHHQKSISDLQLLPTISWHQKLEKFWDIGEQAAEERLELFLDQGLVAYQEKRNYPFETHVSRLSPYIHFGQISPHQVWHSVQIHRMLGKSEGDIDTFLSEIIWREFSYYLLYFFQEFPFKNFQTQFDRFAWQKNEYFIQAWQKGQTGYPIVDAGMRELWQTGYMHNRSRMIVASFLVKNLLIPWQEGAKWFWDCLVDADLANNSASWQWVAGSGVDAAPYFRIFNPVLQGKKFDPEGKYIRHFVPELARLPTQYLFEPWQASPEILRKAQLVLGKDYPEPIVDLHISRNRAMQAYRQL